jgi:hypothetical protein
VKNTDSGDTSGNSPEDVEFDYLNYAPTVQKFFMPLSLWHRGYDMPNIARNGNLPCGISSFDFCGTDYVTVRVFHNGDCIEGEAWTFVPLHKWSEVAFDFGALRDEWKAGKIEQGDRRGLLVRVNSQLCVLERQIHFYDDSLKSETFALQYDALMELEQTEKHAHASQFLQ